MLGAIVLAGASGPAVSRRVVEAVRATGLEAREFYFKERHSPVYETALALEEDLASPGINFHARNLIRCDDCGLEFRWPGELADHRDSVHWREAA